VQDWFPWNGTTFLAALEGARTGTPHGRRRERVPVWLGRTRENSAHDVDVAVRLSETFSAPGLNYFSRLTELEGRLSGILGCKVDVVEEPVRSSVFQTEIDRDRALAF